MVHMDVSSTTVVFVLLSVLVCCLVVTWCLRKKLCGKRTPSVGIRTNNLSHQARMSNFPSEVSSSKWDKPLEASNNMWELNDAARAAQGRL